MRAGLPKDDCALFPAVKCATADGRDCFRHRDAFQTGTSLKGPSADGTGAMGDGQLCEGRAALEGVVSNVPQTIRKENRGQAAAVPKCS